MGLLLLRATLGITVLAQSVIFLTAEAEAPFQLSFAAISAIVGGVLILAGFLTPVIGSLLLAGSLIAAVFPAANQHFAAPFVYSAILSAAVVLLGPGAFSLDARLFGRREIIIPKN